MTIAFGNRSRTLNGKTESFVASWNNGPTRRLTTIIHGMFFALNSLAFAPNQAGRAHADILSGSEIVDALETQAEQLRDSNTRLKDSLDRHRTKLKATEKAKAKLKTKLEHYAEKAAVSPSQGLGPATVPCLPLICKHHAQKNERLRKRLEAENMELSEQMNKVLMKNRQLAFQKQDLEQSLMSTTLPASEVLHPALLEIMTFSTSEAMEA